jgi:hypothetical protein
MVTIESRASGGNMKRKIAVITSSRADYSHLHWPLRDLSTHRDVELRVMALGSHLPPNSATPFRKSRKTASGLTAAWNVC